MHKLILFDWGNVLLNSDSNDYSISDARIASDPFPNNDENDGSHSWD